MIKNIIIDFGGVLIGLDKDRCVAEYNALGMDVIGQYVNDYRSEDLFNDLELGKIDIHEFCNEARKQSGINATDEQIQYAWLALLKDVPQKKLDKILELQKHYRILLLSNTNAFHWEYSVEHFFKDWSIYFEKVYLSYELGITKPNHRMFYHMLNDSGIKAEETLFLDDSAANCKAAEAIGIHTWHIGEDEDWTQRNFENL